MMICILELMLLGHLFTMYMTVCLMVIDTQDLLAAGERAYPVIR
jgi:hypothetical protein